MKNPNQKLALPLAITLMTGLGACDKTEKFESAQNRLFPFCENTGDDMEVINGVNSGVLQCVKEINQGTESGKAGINTSVVDEFNTCPEEGPCWIPANPDKRYGKPALNLKLATKPDDLETQSELISCTQRAIRQMTKKTGKQCNPWLDRRWKWNPISARRANR